MFSINKLLIVIVLYNEKLINSASFQGIVHYANDLNLYIYDNSLLPDNDIALYPFLTYVHDPQNNGVSTAYNLGAVFAQHTKKEWLLLFDQDTVLPPDFLAVLQSQIASLPESDLYAMKLIKQGKLISPCGYKYKKGYILKDIGIGKGPLKNINFLNSGLIVSTKLFLEAGGYDNNVPLYYSDFVFINRVKKIVNEFVLLPIELQHYLSSDDVSNRDSFKKRYLLYLEGAAEAMKSEGGIFYYYITTLLRGIKLSFILKDKYYIIMYFKNMLKL